MEADEQQASIESDSKQLAKEHNDLKKMEIGQAELVLVSDYQ